MNRIPHLVCLGLSSLLAAAAWGAPAPQAATRQPAPATRPALPAGHPDIGGVSASKPALPAGHPDVGGGQGTGPADPSLPAGHPAVGGPVAAFGTLTVRVQQGTKGGPAVARDLVVVDLYNSRGAVVRSVSGTLDAQGAATFERLPLAVPFQPLVRVTHGGVEHTAVGNVMDGRHSGQQVRMTVYEWTETPPAWSVTMRHVIIDPTPEGVVSVTEILSVQNPTDRAWVGRADANGARVTLVLPVTPGADRFEFPAGQQARSVRKDENRLAYTAPLLPGASEFQISYSVPVTNGKARVALAAPADVGNTMVFVVDRGATVNVENLQASGSHDMGGAKALMFGASNVKAGAQAVLTLTVPPAAAAGRSGKGRADAGGAAMGKTAKVVAGIGGGVGLVVGVGYVLLKPAARG